MRLNERVQLRRCFGIAGNCVERFGLPGNLCLVDYCLVYFMLLFRAFNRVSQFVVLGLYLIHLLVIPGCRNCLAIFELEQSGWCDRFVCSRFNHLQRLKGNRRAFIHSIDAGINPDYLLLGIDRQFGDLSGSCTLGNYLSQKQKYERYS